jgi:NifU-like protein involved in Fe-S cluster formation
MRQHDKELLDKINKAANIIALKTRQSGASWMVASASAAIYSITNTKILKILKNIKEYNDRCKTI